MIGPARDALAAAVLILWVPAVVALFRALGPARASLVAILGGLLFLPRVQLPVGMLPFDKRVATGLGLILGVLCLDIRSWTRARPRWLDLPMALYVAIPLAGLALGDRAATRDSVDSFAQRLLGWAVPYAIGRLYFGDADGPRRVAVGIVLAGLAYVPVCLYEEFAGPDRYLSTLIYGTHFVEGQVDRLGGFRPEGFLQDGLQLASWMALASTTAVWLWLGPAHRSSRVPIWLAAPALILTTISCRGVYGLITLACGIVSALATRAFRTRLALVALAVVPIAYMATRASGLWDGRALDRAAVLMGRPGTVGFRLDAEDEVIGRVLRQAPAFGFGNYVWHSAEPIRWPDGQWLQILWSGGLFGLAVAVVGLHGYPAARALAQPRRRPTAAEAASPPWALACWAVLALGEMLHNNSVLGVSGLVAGSIVAASFDPKAPAARAGRSRGAAPTARAASYIPLVVTVAILLIVEVLGRLPRPGGPARPPESSAQPTRSSP